MGTSVIKDHPPTSKNDHVVDLTTVKKDAVFNVTSLTTTVPVVTHPDRHANMRQDGHAVVSAARQIRAATAITEIKAITKSHTVQHLQLLGSIRHVRAATSS
jgi:hypothetical protein